ncbi:MAG: hypothetical protein ACPGJW_02560, partial [Paracoccaceae bacterium]
AAFTTSDFVENPGSEKSRKGNSRIWSLFVLSHPFLWDPLTLNKGEKIKSVYVEDLGNTDNPSPNWVRAAMKQTPLIICSNPSN